MKKFIPLLLAFLFLLPTISCGQIFSQDFSSSTTVSDYVNASPNSTQFDNISATSGSTVNISSNMLILARSTGGHARFVRITNLSSSTINGLIFKFDINITGNSVATTSACKIFIGSNVGNNVSSPASSDYYARLYINVTATVGQFQLRDSDGSTNSANLSGTQSITWVINNTGSPLNYSAPDGSTESVSNDKIDIWAGTTRIFNEINPQNAGATGGLVQFKAVFDAGVANLSFDNFSIDGGTDALPVELVSFRSNVIGKKVELKWQTATEVNNYGFEIERASSATDTNWVKIGFVQGYGNSNSPKKYSFTDEPMGGKEFKYRLKQIDFDGKYEYSDDITASFQNVTNFELEQNYPNPFNPSTKISYTIPVRSNVKLRVYNMLAQLESELVNESQEAGHYQVIFNGSNLPSGTYFYKLEAGKFVEVKKFLLVK